MARVLLLIVSFLGATAAQQRFDSMGHPLFEVVTALSSLNSRPLLLVDQHHVEVDGTPITQFSVDPQQPRLPQVPSPSLPPQSQQQPPSPSQLQQQPPPPSQLQQQQQQPPPPPSQILSPLFPMQIASHRQPAVINDLHNLLLPSPVFQRQPQSSSPVMPPPVANRLGILNRDRIRVEGFQPIERRTIKRRRSQNRLDDWDPFKEDAREGFLPVDASTKLPGVESFDQTDSSDGNGVIEEGSGDFRNLVIVDLPSLTNLHRESGYKESDTQPSNRISKFSNVAISRMQQEEEEEKSNSILDGEGSALGEITEVEDRPAFRSFDTSLKIASQEETEETENELETTTELPTLTSTTSTLSVNLNFTTMGSKSSTRTTVKPFVPSPATASPNSVPFVRDSRLLRIVKEYAGLIVGSILGIPAIVVLCYFIYLKRLKKYTGTLDVSPRQTICHHKKSESRQAICSEENELACSPSTCASKTPQPPPFPTCKRYVP